MQDHIAVLGTFVAEMAQNYFCQEYEIGCVFYTKERGDHEVVTNSPVQVGGKCQITLPWHEYPTAVGDYHNHPDDSGGYFSAGDIVAFGYYHTVFSFLSFKKEVMYVQMKDFTKRHQSILSQYYSFSPSVKRKYMKELKEAFEDNKKFLND